MLAATDVKAHVTVKHHKIAGCPLKDKIIGKLYPPPFSLWLNLKAQICLSLSDWEINFFILLAVVKNEFISVLNTFDITPLK